MDTMENDIEISKAKDEKKERKKAKQILTEQEREEIKNDIKEYIVWYFFNSCVNCLRSFKCFYRFGYKKQRCSN